MPAWIGCDALPDISVPGFLLLPAAAVTGALMTGLCDLIARNIIAPIELPLAAITSAIGAPIVVYLLTRGDKDR